MLQLYGNPRSRAMRCLWMLEEMGKPYQLIEKSTRADDLQSAEYLRLNPNARIPTLVDGDLVLWESMAINLYLAQKYEGPMHCAGPEVLGLAAQWSFWAMLEMEELLLDLLQHRAMLPEFARDASYAERDELLLKKPLGVLNDALAGRDYLVGNSFTVADLNVASCHRIADMPDAVGLLRANRERPRRCCPGNCYDEIASTHHALRCKAMSDSCDAQSNQESVLGEMGNGLVCVAESLSRKCPNRIISSLQESALSASALPQSADLISIRSIRHGQCLSRLFGH